MVLLTDKEKEWLGDDSQFGIIFEDDFYVFEVKDVFTNYKFVTGPRSYDDDPRGKKLSNRWEKNNDYLAKYTWEIEDPEKKYDVSSFISEYEADMKDRSKTWMWKDWANHYSSVWKGKLKITEGDKTLDGIPPYLDNSDVQRLNELQDLDNSYLDYISNDIFGEGKYPDQRKAHWQFTVPLVSTTTYHGYRQRTNPSCIYDIASIFSRTNGAFTGKPYDPNHLKTSDFQAPNTSDETKDKQDFYYNLKYGRIFVTRRIKGYELKVFQKNKLIDQNHVNHARKKALAENKEEDNKVFNDITVYPNPSNGIFTVQFGKHTGNVSNIRITDVNLKQVFSKKVASSKKMMTIDVSKLTKGVYVLTIFTDKESIDKKIVIE